MSTIVSSISAMSVLGKLRETEQLKQGQSILDYRVAGTATSFREVNHEDGGTSVCFRGEFAAVNYETGEKFVSGEFYPPATIAKLLRGRLESETSLLRKSIDIALEIGREFAEKRTDDDTGYRWFVQSVSDKQAPSKAEAQLLTGKPIPQRQFRLSDTNKKA